MKMKLRVVVSLMLIFAALPAQAARPLPQEGNYVEGFGERFRCVQMTEVDSKARTFSLDYLSCSVDLVETPNGILETNGFTCSGGKGELITGTFTSKSYERNGEIYSSFEKESCDFGCPVGGPAVQRITFKPGVKGALDNKGLCKEPTE